MRFNDVAREGTVAGELKYCERCGGLFVRPPADERVYCARCAVQLAQEVLAEQAIDRRPKDRIHKRSKKLPILGSLSGRAARIGNLHGVATWEVRA